MSAITLQSCDSIVGIATVYRQDDRGVRVQDTETQRILMSPYHPEQDWGLPNLLYNGSWGTFPGGKAVGA
jgi:hypothetical protein